MFIERNSRLHNWLTFLNEQLIKPHDAWPEKWYYEAQGLSFSWDVDQMVLRA